MHAIEICREGNEQAPTAIVDVVSDRMSAEEAAKKSTAPWFTGTRYTRACRSSSRIVSRARQGAEFRSENSALITGEKVGPGYDTSAPDPS